MLLLYNIKSAFKTILYLKVPFFPSSLTTLFLWPLKYGPRFKVTCPRTFTVLLSNILATPLPREKTFLNGTLLSRPIVHFAICQKHYFILLQAARHTLRPLHITRHNSALNFLAQSLKAIPNCSLYADLSGYLSPSIITGDAFRPDLLLVTSDHRLFIFVLMLTTRERKTCISFTA